MNILLLMLLLVYLLSFLARYFTVPSTLGHVYIKPNKFLAFAVAVIFILVSGLRNNIGDTFFYMHGYVVNDFSWHSIMKQKDIGFNVFQKFLKNFTDDPQILIFIMAFFTLGLIIATLYRYSRLFEIAVYVFITSGAFIVSMNGMRQYFAAAIVFAATRYMIHGNWKRYIGLVVLAAVFHQSALIMIPIYFLVRKKAWTRTTFILISVAILIVFAFNQFQDLLFAALKDTSYGEYQSFNEGGANYIRVIFFAVPIIIAYFGKDKLRELNPQTDVFVNLSLIGLALMIISTQNWIFARMAIYFYLYQIVLVSWIIKVFREKDQKLVYLVLLFIYFVFFFYENVITLDIQYRSDYITWFR